MFPLGWIGFPLGAVEMFPFFFFFFSAGTPLSPGLSGATAKQVDVLIFSNLSHSPTIRTRRIGPVFCDTPPVFLSSSFSFMIHNERFWLALPAYLLSSFFFSYQREFLISGDFAGWFFLASLPCGVASCRVLPPYFLHPPPLSPPGAGVHHFPPLFSSPPVLVFF